MSGTAILCTFVASAVIARTVFKEWGETTSIIRKGTATAERYNVPLGRSPIRGAQAPTITIVEFVDMFCHPCGQSAPTLDTILQAHPNDVALVVKHSPLKSTRIDSFDAAILTEMAAEKGKFWDAYYTFMWHSRKMNRPQYALADVRAKLGISEREMITSREDPRYSNRIQEDMRLAERLNAKGTPFFFINGRALRGSKPVEVFLSNIDAEQEHANNLILSGVPRAQLYRRFTDSGLASIELPLHRALRRDALSK